MSEPTPITHLTLEQTRHLGAELLEAMPGGVVFVNPDGSIEAANRTALSWLGMSYDSLTERYVADYTPETFHENGAPCPPEDYPVTFALTTGKPHPGRTIGVRRPDGSTMWAVFRAVPVKDETGAVAGACVTFFDITARKLAEEEARANQERLRHSQSLAKVGWWELTFATGQVLWSDEMCAIYGVKPDEFGGTLEDSLAAIHPDDRTVVTERVQIAAEKGVPMPTEYRVVRPDGTIRVVWAVGELVHDAQGNAPRMRGAVLDITERKELEGHLMQAQRLESIGQLAGGIAHDFNNLLQVILGNAMSAQGATDCSLELEHIVTAAERASGLTKQLLAFGRRQSFEPKIIDAHELVRTTEQMLLRTLAGSVSLEVRPHSDQVFVSADRNQLEQVLVNLCLNARDATPENGRVTISTESFEPDPEFRAERSWAVMERYVRISVNDNGSGIAPDVLPRIFEPFFTTKPVGSGSGLGLAAVYGITREHEGMIEVESEEGQGTTFHVYLPQVSPGRASAEPSLSRAQPAPFSRKGNDSSPAVLIVEDDDMVLDLTVRTLKRGGFKTVSAAGPGEALRILTERQVAIGLVLTDIVMPEMNGIELAEKIEQLAPGTAVLFTTGHAAEQLNAAIPKDRVVTKPYDPATLCQRVEAVLEAATSGS